MFDGTQQHMTPCMGHAVRQMRVDRPPGLTLEHKHKHLVAR